MGKTVKRRRRATPAEVAARKDRALKAAIALAKHMKWMAAGDIATNVSGRDPNLSRTLSLLVADGKLCMSGERKMARYRVEARALRKAA